MLARCTDELLQAVRSAELRPHTGIVTSCGSFSAESVGPDTFMGEVCEIFTSRESEPLAAEVVGFRENRVVLMPYGSVEGIRPGSEVMATGLTPQVSVSDGLLGRVLDGLGRPIDGRSALECAAVVPVRARSPNPLLRARVIDPIETGVKAIDCLMTTGAGQRVGIFSGSGVGKSSLLGMIARHLDVDVNVVALIGERGRELRDFVETSLATRRESTVIIVATSDEPAIIRVRAAWTAVVIAEYFRDAGRRVGLYLDSLTRLAMAQREIGLAAGEPPTSRGYTPSVFSMLPQIVERVGPGVEGTGVITGFFTVLVEGDDLNDPIADHVRAILDGHIVLSRKLAQLGQYPAIDVLQSVSRVMPNVVDAPHRSLAGDCVSVLAQYEEARDMIEFGAYREGANAAVDRSVKLTPRIRDFLRQPSDASIPLRESLRQLGTLLGVRA
jgi:flagellum-specific ATP synthase